jgi:hypothetical protein
MQLHIGLFSPRLKKFVTDHVLFEYLGRLLWVQTGLHVAFPQGGGETVTAALILATTRPLAYVGAISS